MNILTDTLPSSVEIGGVEYAIATDYRAALRVIMAYEDNDLTSLEKQLIMIANLYPSPPPDANAAIERASWYLNGGEESKSEGGPGPRLYSFTKDANLIFAAFRQTHGVDLQKSALHWWEFLALFMDLGSETTFCQLVGLRKRIKTGKASKEERHAAFEMGDLFDVPDIDDRTIEEKEMEARFMELTKQAQRNNGNV